MSDMNPGNPRVSIAFSGPISMAEGIGRTIAFGPGRRLVAVFW